MNESVISVIVPCYNSEQFLEELVNRLNSALGNKLLEIILINDCSTDNTWDVIKGLSKKFPFVKGISMMKNFGQHSAIICGFNHVKGEYTVTIDDDLQNPPEEILNLVIELEKDNSLDVVIGIPDIQKTPFIKRMGRNYLNHLTSKLLNKPKDLKMNSFRVLRRRIVNELKLNITKNPAIGSLLLLYTRRIKNVRVRHDERKYGKSGYSLKKSIKLFLNHILNYSNLPLQFVSMFGIFWSIIGFIMAIYYTCQYLIYSITVPGWTALISISLIFFGIILFALGIIGEYLIRIITEVNHSRQYVIKKKVGFFNNNSTNEIKS